MNDSVLELWHGVLFRQRPDLTFEWISPRVEQWTGTKPNLALEAVHPDDRGKLKGEHATFRLRHARTGRITWVEQRRRGVEGYWENITERVNLSQQLAQAHWEGALGAATNRLVHDFNNLLTGILSLSDAYLTMVQPDNPAREGLRLLNQNARQAADIVQEIGRLFREVPGQRSYQNLRELASTAGDVLRRVLPRHSSVTVKANPESIPVYLDPAELKQQVVALGLNLTPPIILEAGLEHHAAWLRIGDHTLRFPEADFSEADKDAAQPRSILLAGHENKDLFETADLFRRNGYEVVVGGEDALDLLRSPDYRFDAVWVRSAEARPFPSIKRVVSTATGSEALLAELRAALQP